MDANQYFAEMGKKPKSQSFQTPKTVRNAIEEMLGLGGARYQRDKDVMGNTEELIQSLTQKLQETSPKPVSASFQSPKQSLDISEIERKVTHFIRLKAFARELCERRRKEEICKVPSLQPSVSLPHLSYVKFGDSKVEYIFRSRKNDIPAKKAGWKQRKPGVKQAKTSHKVTTEIVEADEDETSTHYFQVRESPTPYSMTETLSEFDDAVKMLLGKTFSEQQHLSSGRKVQFPIPEEDSHYASSDDEEVEEIECVAGRRRAERDQRTGNKEEDWPNVNLEPLGLRLYRPMCPPASKDVPANDAAPHFGPMMKYGFLRKKRGEHKKFHKRWVVLRGFRLYWYRKSDATWAKGVIPIPSEPLITLTVNREQCFGLSKGKKRHFVIVEDTASAFWAATLTNQIAYKQLLEDPGLYHDFHEVVNYFQNLHVNEMRIGDRSLPGTVVGYLSVALPAHTKLQIVALRNCQLTDESIKGFLGALIGTARIETLDLSSNHLTSSTAAKISELVKQEETQWNVLMNLTLSGNPIGDEGLDLLCRGFRVRFEEMFWPKAMHQLPFFTLEVSSCDVGDAGLCALYEVLDLSISLITTEADIEPRMRLDLSHNHCSSLGFRRLISLLGSYQPICVLNLSYIGTVTTEDVVRLLEVMIQNYSILELSAEGLEMSNDGIAALVELLKFNYVLSSIKVTLTTDTLEVASSHYRTVKPLFTLKSD